ncbi:MAG TPA: aminotransferase class V-fold PLP-dependent enzyme [Segetibacter sp.]|jgi:aspartate aminotransferase-like enzyme
MISKEINFSTGPTALHEKVKLALIEDPVSHRSEEFEYLLDKTCRLYKEHLQVKEVFFLTGSGTTANEAMLHQMKMLHKPGLILSNGEFGNRLINQAATNDLQFSFYKVPYGKHFDYGEIEQLIKEGNINWVLFTHCETSTGIINNLNVITELCKKYQALCFVDCISSVGAFKIDLSQVAMATASSGKGLCGIAGLAVVLSNISTKTNKKIPACLDLTNYSNSKVPFTISSNLLKAIYTGSKLKLHRENYDVLADASQQISYLLKYYGFTTFNANSHVFTIISTHADENKWLANELTKHGLITSYKSEYLQKNNWLQIALFGIFTNSEMHEGLKRLKSLLSCKVLN